jgi:hypothetical protein
MEMFESNAEWSEGAKKVVEFYIEGGQKLGKAMLDLHQSCTSWAKDTPLCSIFEAQRTAAKGMFEDSAALTRKLWRIQQEAFKA